MFDRYCFVISFLQLQVQENIMIIFNSVLTYEFEIIVFDEWWKLLL